PGGDRGTDLTGIAHVDRRAEGAQIEYQKSEQQSERDPPIPVDLRPLSTHFFSRHQSSPAHPTRCSSPSLDILRIPSEYWGMRPRTADLYASGNRRKPPG